MKTPDRFPLAWPAHRPRTPNLQRRHGQFKSGGKLLSPAEAMVRVENELERIGGRLPVLSSNLELRLDGRPRGDRSAPADPGVCLYFALKNEPFALACDTYTDAAQNIAALAAHLDATRAITRYGVASAAETLQAFSALPPPASAGRSWRDVLGFEPLFPGELSADEAKALISVRHKTRLRAAHPDAGGTDAAAAELNAAKDAAFAELDAQ